MSVYKKLSYHDQETLFLVSNKGRLRKLTVPFQVRCIRPIGAIKIYTKVYVEAVAEHQHEKILYRILNQWIPYHHFQLTMYY